MDIMHSFSSVKALLIMKNLLIISLTIFQDVVYYR